eukprot:COSAG01_NODE_1476_length_10188_cov_16.029537_13_plen_151_part_00
MPHRNPAAHAPQSQSPGCSGVGGALLAERISGRTAASVTILKLLLKRSTYGRILTESTRNTAESWHARDNARTPAMVSASSTRRPRVTMIHHGASSVREPPIGHGACDQCEAQGTWTPIASCCTEPRDQKIMSPVRMILPGAPFTCSHAQ